jgi:lysophospholipase L1-like esterase
MFMHRSALPARVLLLALVLLLGRLRQAEGSGPALRHPGAGAGRQPDGAARRDPGAGLADPAGQENRMGRGQCRRQRRYQRRCLQRLPGLIEEHNPQLVLVTLGGNDMLRRLPQGQTTANLGRMLALAKTHGAKAVLLATPKPSLAGAAFNNLSAAEFYREVAKESQVPLIEDAMAEVLSKTELKGDQLHPNAAGHALLAEKIFEGLKKIGYAR